MIRAFRHVGPIGTLSLLLLLGGCASEAANKLDLSTPDSRVIPQEASPLAEASIPMDAAVDSSPCDGGACCTPDCHDKCAGASDGCGQTCSTNTCAGCCEALICKAACSDTFWIGPTPFYSGRVIKTEYKSLAKQAVLPEWSNARMHANGFKSYLMALPDTGSAYDFTDAELRSLIQILSRANLQVAFEVGGLRVGYFGECDNDFGGRTADAEFRHLERWLDLGGRIDFLTTDHALHNTLSSRRTLAADETPCLLDLSGAIDQLMAYFTRMTLLFTNKGKPVPKFGVIEGLGIWEIMGLDGYLYQTLDATLLQIPSAGIPAPFAAQEIKFANMFQLLMAAAANNGIRIHHFDFDYGPEGVTFDGKKRGWTGPDYGRVMAVERHIQTRSAVEVGVIANAFHEDHPYVQLGGDTVCYRVDESNPHLTHCTIVGAAGGQDAQDAVSRANRSAYERTLAFLEGYYGAGGNSKRILAQSWQPHPNQILPETESYTHTKLVNAIYQLTQP